MNDRDSWVQVQHALSCATGDGDPCDCGFEFDARRLAVVDADENLLADESSHQEPGSA